jgi:hypothetical protein
VSDAEQKRKWREQSQKWRDANPEKHRNGVLRRKYGVTTDEYDEMLAEQGGVCAICRGINLSGRRLAVDHDHETDRPRGLLCSTCNTGIGGLKDDPELLIAAAAYLMERADEP